MWESIPSPLSPLSQLNHLKRGHGVIASSLLSGDPTWILGAVRCLVFDTRSFATAWVTNHRNLQVGNAADNFKKNMNMTGSWNRMHTTRAGSEVQCAETTAFKGAISAERRQLEIENLRRSREHEAHQYVGHCFQLKDLWMGGRWTSCVQNSVLQKQDIACQHSSLFVAPIQTKAA